MDEIGLWSKNKLDIVKLYTEEYSKIVSKFKFEHSYVDGFAGAGMHKFKNTGEFVKGSPLRILELKNPFRKHYLIDKDETKIQHLKRTIGNRSDVVYFYGDSNIVLINEVFPLIRYEDYKRAFCLLDPYGIHIDWKVVEAAGKAKSIELLIHFSTMDINMNVLKRNRDAVDQSQIERMNRFWGDGSWRDVGYSSEMMLFKGKEYEEKVDNDTMAEAYMERLKNVAGFKYVLKPLPMRNSNGATIYYLLFATHNQTGEKIMRHIFDKYRK
ncbi:MAG: three-Cys-motif partner protein TcmP [Deltaproteobacteria bacterium]|nr:three-Cys-motif partner protein TcmP [Deltaproteobacteria bacterium]